jgi:two-component system nitrate/nitrite response regulator NarL
MRRRHSFAITLVGQRGLLIEGIERILRSANLPVAGSVLPGDKLLTEPMAPGQMLFLIVHTGDDGVTAVAQTEFLRSHHPDARIAIVAASYRPDELIGAFRAGASGYFANATSCAVLVKSLELVMMGGAVFPPAFLPFDPVDQNQESKQEITVDSSNAVAPSVDGVARLSPREKSILRCLIEGDSNKCIARRVDISEATVKVHIKAILRKIRVQNRTQAAIWGINHAFSEVPSPSLARLECAANNEYPSSITTANGQTGVGSTWQSPIVTTRSE